MNTNQSAIDRVNQMRMKAQEIANKLQSKVSVQPEKSKVNQVDLSELRLFVKNLKPETTEEKLKAYFGRWGKVEDIFIRQSNHKFDGIRNCMAFITFNYFFKESPLSLFMHIIDGNSVPVYKVQTKPKAEYQDTVNSKTIMITGTIQDLKDVHLLDYFGKFGNLLKVTRKRDLKNPQQYQRFAFVIFYDPQAVDKVIAQQTHKIKGIVIDVQRCKDK